MTTIMSLAVAALAGLAAWRLVNPLSYAVYCACGGRRTASGTAGRWLALAAGSVAPVGLIAAIWAILLRDPTTWSAPQPYHLAVMAASIGLSLGYFSSRRRPGTVIWHWRRERFARAERLAQKQSPARGERR